jgi:hypothetical protein
MATQNASLPYALTMLGIGRNDRGTNSYLNGSIERFEAYPRWLSDAGLQAGTSA